LLYDSINPSDLVECLVIRDFNKVHKYLAFIIEVGETKVKVFAEGKVFVLEKMWITKVISLTKQN